MQRTMKKGGLLLALLAALIATTALASPSSASALGFCGGQKVNNVNKCWGAPRLMGVGQAWGLSTGVCVGADLYEGSCAPTHQWAWVAVPQNTHYPWVMGTASAFTVVEGFTE